MDEKSKEFVARKKWDKGQVALFVGVAVALVVALAIVLKFAPFIAWLFIFVALSLYYIWNIFKAEYAYTISGKIVVEILKSGGKRTPLCEFFLADMTLCGKYNADNKAKIANVGKTIKACTDAKDEDETYFALFERNGSETVLLFTPDDMMLAEMKKHTKCVIE